MRSPGFDFECNIKLGIVAYTCSSGLGRQKQDDQGFKASLIYLRFFFYLLFFLSQEAKQNKNLIGAMPCVNFSAEKGRAMRLGEAGILHTFL